MIHSMLRRFFRLMPPGLQAKADILRDRWTRPRHSVRFEFGGPFNGQSGRREIVRELLCKIHFDFIIETGTFRGVTTQFLISASEVPVYSIEAIPRYFKYTDRVLRQQLQPEHLSRLRLMFGDSRSVLPDLGRLSGTGLFYLDAHWQDDLPLWEELDLVRRMWSNAVVVIDDFAVPGDDGYGFDDYGGRNRLTPENLPSWVWTDRKVCYPTRPSAKETGSKRGCIVIMPRTTSSEFMTLREATRTWPSRRELESPH